MKFFLGMDVGTVSAKWALVGARDRIDTLAAKQGSPVAEVYPLSDRGRGKPRPRRRIT